MEIEPGEMEKYEPEEGDDWEPNWVYYVRELLIILAGTGFIAIIWAIAFLIWRSFFRGYM